MLVNLINRNDLIDSFKTYVGTIPIKRIDETSRLSIANTANLIQCKTEKTALHIECDENEIETLINEYLKMIDKKHHLAIIVLVDRMSSVDSIPKLDKVCKLAAYYKAYPTNTNDRKIKMLVAFLKDSSGLLDVDFAIKNVLKP